MRRLLSLAPLLLLLMTTPAHANLWGKYLQTCPRAVPATATAAPNENQNDPIVNPGQVGGADHNHTAQGSQAFGANMTTGSMYAAATTCFLHPNHTSYWAPTMDKDGVSYTAVFSSYYAAAGVDPALISGGKVQPFPTGFRAVFRKGEGSSVRWRCGGTAVYTSPPPTCINALSMEFDTPQCWDGMNLNSANQHAHIANRVGAGCPASHPVSLPQLQAAFTYPAAANGGRLSSDHDPTKPAGYSAHFDIWEAQDPAVQDQLTRCLNDPARNFATAPLCGLFTYDGPPNPPNAWFPNLVAWSNAIGYVKADGSTNPLPVGTP